MAGSSGHPKLPPALDGSAGDNSKKNSMDDSDDDDDTDFEDATGVPGEKEWAALVELEIQKFSPFSHAFSMIGTEKVFRTVFVVLKNVVNVCFSWIGMETDMGLL